jgi:activator of 2-hydroxyglutaryl-CoA dehydratase
MNTFFIGAMSISEAVKRTALEYQEFTRAEQDLLRLFGNERFDQIKKRARLISRVTPMSYSDVISELAWDEYQKQLTLGVDYGK